MRRRSPIRYASLTSLLDVLFILVFASLIHAAATVERAHGEVAGLAPTTSPDPESDAESDAEPEPEPGSDLFDADAGVLEPSRDQLYQQALSELAQAIAERSVTFARVSARGILVSIERDELGADEASRLALAVPLLERVPDPDLGVVYLGERITDLRICTVVRRHLGRDDLGGELVIIVPKVPLAELEVALVRGLRRDQDRCLRDEGAVGVVVDPLRAQTEQPWSSP